MISLRSVSKRYPNGVLAVDRLDLEVNTGELCAVVGPSGCGKTTTLKMLNRLISPTSGEILVAGENVMETDPVALRRKIGYVMQHGGLFPHRRVADNVAAVPRLLGWSRERIRARVNELLELVGLDPAVYASRYPHQLSGGERQRVGVARALGGDPPVLLMDEPFGAVDPVTRTRLQDEFLSLQASLQKTVVLVTHDIDEAVKLGNTIAVMATGGVLEQHAPPATILAQPRSAFVREFVGAKRALRRLDVTKVTLADLDTAAMFPADTAVASVRKGLLNAGSEFAVVLDEDARALGWVLASELDPDGDDLPIGACPLRAVTAVVALPATLAECLSAMLEQDGAFVAVIEGASCVGLVTPATIHKTMRRALPGEERAEP